MEIEFQPHRGVSKERNARGKAIEKTVELDQWQILSKDPSVAIHDGQGEFLLTRLAYVGKAAGSPIMFVRQYPEAVHESVKAAVADKIGGKSITKQPPARWIEADDKADSDESDEDEDTDLSDEELDDE